MQYTLKFMIRQCLNQYSSIYSKILRRHTEMIQETVKDKENNNKERDEGS